MDTWRIKETENWRNHESGGKFVGNFFFFFDYNCNEQWLHVTIRMMRKEISDDRNTSRLLSTVKN